MMITTNILDVLFHHRYDGAARGRAATTRADDDYIGIFYLLVATQVPCTGSDYIRVQVVVKIVCATGW